MKLVILAGGRGTRLGAIADSIPKPMVEIGGKPILWHIMKIYSYYGINEFIICLGYKAQVIKDYFADYCIKNTDFTVDLSTKSLIFHNQHQEADWKVTLIDTGLNTLKGARLKMIERYLTDEVNLLTYGDGLANINIQELIKFHNANNKIVTISGVHPPARFGELKIKENEVVEFKEKAFSSQELINGGYMVFSKELLNYLSLDPKCDLEYGTFEMLASQGQIGVYKHSGQWACMDDERDMQMLNKLWEENRAFWKVW